MKTKLVAHDLDDRLRALLNGWRYPESDSKLLALGAPALERLIDCLEGKVDLYRGDTELEGREYDDARQAAVAAFARADVAAVLRALVARGWSDLRIALSGIGRVSHPSIVPYVLAAYASKEPLHRADAVNCLAVQLDARAIDPLIGALRDRSSFVRYLAIEALGKRGDARAVEPLRALAKRSVRSPSVAKSANAAIKKIRARLRAIAP